MSNHNRRRCRYACPAAWTSKVVLVSIAGLGLLTAGCHRKNTTATQPAAVGEFSGVANNVTVTMTATAISVPEIISSGWTNFIVTNGDTVPHTFGIEGNGVNRIIPGALQPGETQQLRAQLRPGTYRAYCPTCGQAMTGMSRQVTVAQW